VATPLIHRAVRAARLAPLLALPAVLVLLSCDRKIVEVVPVASVDVAPSSPPPLLVGGSIQLNATPRSARGEALQRTIAWSSSNNSVATVSASGAVAAVGAGTATITASADGHSGTSSVRVDNPTPAITSIAPTTVTAGSGGFTLDVQGSGFIPSSTVRVDGAVRNTQMVSGSLLRATIPAADIAVAGTRQITVENPAPGGGLSNPRTLVVTAVVASVTVLPQGHQMGLNWAWFFTATARNSAGQVVPDAPIAWSSSNPAVATVNSQGLVSAQSAGTALIRATSGSVTGQSTITIAADPCAPVTVWPPTETIIATLGTGCTVFDNPSQFFAFSSSQPFGMTLTTKTSEFHNSSTWWRADGLQRARRLGALVKVDPNDTTDLVNTAILPAGSYIAEVRSLDGRVGSYTAAFEFGDRNPAVTNCRFAFILSPVDYQGTIEQSDCDPTRLPGPGHGDRFVINMRVNETITINLTSTAVNTQLYVLDTSGNVLAADNDSGSGTNSRLVFTATAAELHVIAATTVGAGAFGAYRMTVTSNLAGDLAPDALDSVRDVPALLAPPWRGTRRPPPGPATGGWMEDPRRNINSVGGGNRR
jgi:hypothetical protein